MNLDLDADAGGDCEGMPLEKGDTRDLEKNILACFVRPKPLVWNVGSDYQGVIVQDFKAGRNFVDANKIAGRNDVLLAAHDTP